MRLTDEFTVSTPPDRAFAMLLDLERVAPCIPGGEIDPPDADGVYPGRVSVKLGPMKFVYAGRVRFAEQDPARRTAVIEGEGRAAGGADTAKVRSVMEVLPEGDGSRVRITTDLDIKGRAAQMGQGVIVDVSRRLVSQAAACIEARLSAPTTRADDSLPTAGPVGGISLDGVRGRLAHPWPGHWSRRPWQHRGRRTTPSRGWRRCDRPKEPMMERADLTLTAGPNDLSADVLAALGSPILYHYDPVFLERFRAAEQQIARIFRTTSHEIILMQGEAVLGLEAAARAVVSPGMACLNLVSGVFGKGFGYWLTAIGAELHEIEVGYDEAIDPAAVDAYLDAHPEIRMVSVVHSETPSGTLNPVRELGPIARAHDAVTIVDVVSSFGGIELEAEAWQLDLLVAGPQKCLGGPPGMSLMAVSDAAWAAIDAEPARAARLVPVHARLARAVARQRPLPVHAVRVRPARRAGRRERARSTEGLEACQARHARVARAAWAGVEAMGLASVAGTPGDRRRLRDRDPGAGRPDRHRRPRSRAGALRRRSCPPARARATSSGSGHMGATARPMLMVAGLAAIGRSHGRPGRERRHRGRPGRRPGVPVRERSGGRPVTTLAPFELHRVASVPEATALMVELGDDAVLYAGGTELLLLHEAGLRGLRAPGGHQAHRGAVGHRGA